MKIHKIFGYVMASVAVTCGVALMLSAVGAQARPLAPRPALASRSWQLHFSFSKPQRLRVVAGHGHQAHVVTCYYLRYTVVNNTGKDIFFVPRFDMVTDTGRIIPAKVDITGKLFGAIRHRTGDAFLINPMLVAGRLLQGKDYAKDSVAVFMGLTNKDRGFKIFVSGLSGETAVQADPVTGKPVVLHKTLLLHYSVPGEAINMKPHPILLSKTWVMR
ncbi:MAG: hypothetical protein HKL95_02000 [Phycisphaerae bacterium]|nr:hypothetical protein [Phycisphaerae bacterium]